MADFFGDLAGQVLGNGLEVQPLLPSRFASWPDMPLASPLAQAPKPVDEAAKADTAAFPPPLIDPEHPAMDTPLPSLRQLSQVGTGSGPPIQPDVSRAPQDTPEMAGAEPGDMQPEVATPVVPAADGSRPDPTTAMPTADVGQTSEPLPAPPAQPVIQGQDGGATDVAASAKDQMADSPVTPLVHEPVLEPPAPPEPAPILQHQGTPEVGFSPGHDRPTLQRRADTAKGDKSPSISPLQRASPYQPGDSSPGQAAPTENPPLSAEGRPAAARDPAAAVQESRRADTPLRPLVQSAPPGPEPVIQRQIAPGADLPAAAVTLSAAPPSAMGEISAPPLRPRVTSAPGAHSAGETLADAEAAIRPLDQPLMPLAGQPGPAAGQGTPAPAQAASVEQRPPSRIQHEAPDDGRGLPGPVEPTIVPAPEPPSVRGQAPTRDGERVFSRRVPAWAAAGQPEPPPTVRVTIGRVEVRAAADAERPAARRVELPRPPLSLDEYLEATKGGEP